VDRVRTNGQLLSKYRDLIGAPRLKAGHMRVHVAPARGMYQPCQSGALGGVDRNTEETLRVDWQEGRLTRYYMRAGWVPATHRPTRR
jgi:hypothetical protein